MFKLLFSKKYPANIYYTTRYDIALSYFQEVELSRENKEILKAIPNPLKQHPKAQKCRHIKLSALSTIIRSCSSYRSNPLRDSTMLRSSPSA